MTSAAQQISNLVTTQSTTELTVHSTIQHPSIVSTAASHNNQPLSYTKATKTPIIQPSSSLKSAANSESVIQPSEDISLHQICLPSDETPSLLGMSPSLTSSVIQLSSDIKTEDATSTCSKPSEPTTSSIFKAFTNLKTHAHPQQAFGRSLLVYFPIKSEIYNNDETITEDLPKTVVTSSDSDDDYSSDGYMYAYSSDEELDSGTNCNSMVHEDLAERETETDKFPDPQLLPFPAVSVRWYV